jgi:tRNA1(Val) A37 N6-methylase TrmN6
MRPLAATRRARQAEEMDDQLRSNDPAGALSDDGFLDGRLKILQPIKGFRAGIDSVFLAASVPAQAGETVIEAGAGVGVAALCLMCRCPGTHLTGIEIDPDYAALCEENAKRNNLLDRLSLIRGDLRSWPAGAASFDHAMANPPFQQEGRSTPSPLPLKAKAHAFGENDLHLWVDFLLAMLRPGGTMTIVNRTESLANLLSALDGRCGAVTISPLFPRAGSAASRIIVQAVKNSKAPLRLLPGLVLHGTGNDFTPEAQAVLRAGQAFPLT